MFFGGHSVDSLTYYYYQSIEQWGTIQAITVDCKAIGITAMPVPWHHCKSPW